MLSLFWFWFIGLFQVCFVSFLKFCGLFTGKTSDLKLFDHADLEK